jgi:hypothetical protein
MEAVGTNDAGLDVIMRIRLLQAVLFASLAGAGCAGTGQVGYGATATVSTPELVYVSPGVQVIANYDEPVFYSDNYYWRYNSGVWYRSPYHTRGWVRSYDVPVRIRSIDRPTAYIRYRGNNRTVVRDHRRQPAPVVRDNRVDADERRRQQERQQLIRDREEKRQEDRRDLVEDRNEQRTEDRQKLIEQRERERQVDRQRLIEQRDREQKARERERARQNRR